MTLRKFALALVVLALGAAGPAQAQTQQQAKEKEVACVQQAYSSGINQLLADGSYTKADTAVNAQTARFYDYQYDLYDALGQSGYEYLYGLLEDAWEAGSDGGSLYELGTDNVGAGQTNYGAGNYWYNMSQWAYAFTYYSAALTDYGNSTNQFYAAWEKYELAKSRADDAKAIMDLYVP